MKQYDIGSMHYKVGFQWMPQDVGSRCFFGITLLLIRTYVQICMLDTYTRYVTHLQTDDVGKFSQLLATLKIPETMWFTESVLK